MKNLKLILISTVTICAIFSTQAQDLNDFSRYFSQTDKGGSARIQALGGAQTSLGGDISSAYSNPAGLGFFTRSEISISPQFNDLSTSTSYLGTQSDDFKSNFNIANFGIVFKGSNGSGKWKGGSFGISSTRINNFHNDISYEGSNMADDYTRYAIESLNTGFNGVLENLALDPDESRNNSLVKLFNYKLPSSAETILIDGVEWDINSLTPQSTTNDGDSIIYEFYDRNFDSDDNIAFPDPGNPVQQSEKTRIKGAQYQTSLSYGGNYDDKIFFGASLGITSIKYDIEKTYKEVPSSNVLNEITIHDIRKITGSGVNLTLGLIVKPADFLNVGLSYTTPSYYSLTDRGTLDLDAEFTDGIIESGHEFTPFELQLRTPARLNLGVTAFINKQGFITGDVEFVDYRKNNLTSSQQNFSSENTIFRNEFDRTVNYRLGAEYRYEIFRFRAGYSYTADVLKKEVDELNRAVNSFSFGAGVKLKDYFADLSFVSSDRNSVTRPYPGAESAIIDSNRVAATLTVGLRF